MEFQEFNLHPIIAASIKEAGYVTPTPIQQGGGSSVRGDAAVRAVGSTRNAVVRGVGAVQAAAAALDAVDAVCAKGEGVPARRVLRNAEVPVDQARAALRTLPTQLSAYAAALAALEPVARTLVPAEGQALAGVTSSGRTEVAAGRAFIREASSAWPAYARLARDEATWVHRAVTPWYRTRTEGASAYVVLISDRRPALAQARARLAAAAAALQPVMLAQQKVLDAADRVLRQP